jgi:zinc transporter ZupT
VVTCQVPLNARQSQKAFWLKGGSTRMDISRKLGILVFCAVPAIIGGGIIYHIFHSWTPVFIYETLLIFVAGGFVAR